jgi:hypothetical protein
VLVKQQTVQTGLAQRGAASQAARGSQRRNAAKAERGAAKAARELKLAPQNPSHTSRMYKLQGGAKAHPTFALHAHQRHKLQNAA